VLSELPTAVELFAKYPELAVVLAAVMRAGLAYQRGLSWYEYRTLHGMRRILFPVLQDALPVVSFVNWKHGRKDKEFLTTRKATVAATARQLMAGNGSLHLLSSIKRRPEDHGDPLSRAHVVWTHADGRQTEAYLFANDDGTCDVYVHTEESVTDPVGHLTGEQRDGDLRGVVREALGMDSQADSNK